MKNLLVFIAVFCSLLNTSFAQAKKTVPTSPPALSAIKEDDLKKDLYEIAADHFRGREAGTLDELTVSMWIGEELRKIGLKPAGDDGTYFQFFSMLRSRLSTASTIAIDEHRLELWKDVLLTQSIATTVKAPVVFVGTPTVADLDKLDLKGKAVAIQASTEGVNLNVSLPERRYMGLVLNKYRTALQDKGVAAIIFIADTMGEKSWSQVIPALSRGTYAVEGSATTAPLLIPVLWVHTNALNWMRNNTVLNANLQVENFSYPSVNIIGKVEGSDKNLKEEYVLFSGHQDHDGVRQPYGTDSIYNGADDNASVSVALMAIARAFKKSPGKRSALFVWHGAEERGLLGSRWYSVHPTVSKNSIVAVLNADMIGRNHPDSAALLGVQPPHLNSKELVAMAMQANSEGPKFKLDTLWDKTTHIEGWYFRSDHLPYAREGYPAIFYSTLLHSTYHTPMDEANRIDYAKLRKMTEWMYRTGWKVANAAQRPALEEGFKLER